MDAREAVNVSRMAERIWTSDTCVWSVAVREVGNTSSNRSTVARSAMCMWLFTCKPKVTGRSGRGSMACAG